MAYQGIQDDINQVMKEVIASGVQVSTVQFQRPDGNFGPSGAPSGTFVAVPGLVDKFTGSSAITCMDAPLAPGTISALELKSLQEIESQGIRHISLNGFYAQVVANWQSENANMNWRAVLNGQNYEVFGVEGDSQSSQTRVKLRLITV